MKDLPSNASGEQQQYMACAGLCVLHYLAPAGPALAELSKFGFLGLQEGDNPAKLFKIGSKTCRGYKEVMDHLVALPGLDIKVCTNAMHACFTAWSWGGVACGWWWKCKPAPERVFGSP